MRTRACGLLRRDGNVLLQRRRDETVWALPGGKVEAGETPEAALVREFREELGWNVQAGSRLWEIENIFSHGGREVRQAEVCCEVICAVAALTVFDETLEFRWVAAGELVMLDVRPVAIREWLLPR